MLVLEPINTKCDCPCLFHSNTLDPSWSGWLKWIYLNWVGRKKLSFGAVQSIWWSAQYSHNSTNIHKIYPKSFHHTKRMENPSKLSISSSRRLNHHMQALAEMSLVRTWIVMWIVDLGLWIVYVDCGLWTWRSLFPCAVMMLNVAKGKFSSWSKKLKCWSNRSGFW